MLLVYTHVGRRVLRAVFKPNLIRIMEIRKDNQNCEL